MHEGMKVTQAANLVVGLSVVLHGIHELVGRLHHHTHPTHHVHR